MTDTASNKAIALRWLSVPWRTMAMRSARVSGEPIARQRLVSEVMHRFEGKGV